MKAEEIIYLDKYPRLDLHGIDKEYASLLLKDFINENITLKNKYILIVHGIGTGIIKNTCHEILRKNKLVKEFKTVNFNEGSTLVMLNIN